MKKSNLSIFNVNAQQGFLLMDEIIVGVFSRFNNIIYYKIPWKSTDFTDFNLPKELKKFKIADSNTDSFSITKWSEKGYIEF